MTLERLTILLVVMVFAVLTPPDIDVVDARVRVQTARSLAHEGTLAVDTEPNGYGYLTPEGKDGRRYGVYGIGQSLVLTPIVIVIDNLSKSLPVGDNTKQKVSNALLMLVYVCLVSALFGWAFLRVLRELDVSKPAACAGVLITLLCSQWLVWGRSMQEELLAATLLMWALYIALKARPNASWPRAVALGLLFGLLANVRAFAAAPAAAVALMYFVRTKSIKQVLVMLGGAVPGLILFFWHNWFRFGSLSETGYSAYGESIDAGFSFSIQKFFDILAGFDFGLIWFSIPLLFVFWKFKQQRLILIALFVALFAQIVFLSSFYMGDPAGTAGYAGPRYLCHCTLLIWPFIIAALVRLRVQHKRWPIAVLVFAAALQLATIPLSRFAEPAQNAYWQANDMSPTLPQQNIPRRLQNLWLLASGDLVHYTSGKDNPTNTLETALTTNLLPWRINSGASKSLSKSTRYAAIGGWLLLVISALACGYLWRRRFKALSTKPHDGPSSGV